MTGFWRPLALTALAAALVLGCDDGGDGDTDGGLDAVDGGLEGDGGEDAEAGPPQLDGSHESYRVNPRCRDCHLPDDHDEGLLPHECAGCHGTNGARQSHTLVTPCGMCHPGQHDPDGFPDPESCLVCHR